MRIRTIIKAIIFIATFPFLFVACFWGGDITQYKQIGDTHFFLLPHPDGGGAYLYHDANSKGMFYPIIGYGSTGDGIVCDVLWNEQYIIAKCSESGKKPIEKWYILKNIDDYHYKEFAIRQFLNEKDYMAALDSIGVAERDMEHTDGHIPWSLHIW